MCGCELYWRCQKRKTEARPHSMHTLNITDYTDCSIQSRCFPYIFTVHTCTLHVDGFFLRLVFWHFWFMDASKKNRNIFSCYMNVCAIFDGNKLKLRIVSFLCAEHNKFTFQKIRQKANVMFCFRFVWFYTFCATLAS